MMFGVTHAVSLLISHSFTLSEHTPSSILSAHCPNLPLTTGAEAEFQWSLGDWTHEERMKQAMHLQVGSGGSAWYSVEQLYCWLLKSL